MIILGEKQLAKVVWKPCTKTYADCSLENIFISGFCMALCSEDYCAGDVVLIGDIRARLSIQTIHDTYMVEWPFFSIKVQAVTYTLAT